MLSNLQDEPAITPGYLQGVEDGRQSFIELHVHDGADDRHDPPAGRGSSSSSRSDIIPACRRQTRNGSETQRESKNPPNDLLQLTERIEESRFCDMQQFKLPKKNLHDATSVGRGQNISASVAN